MELVKWKDTYSVSVEVIDSQHKRLIDLINELFGAMMKGQAKAMLKATLDELAAYTVEHFGTEEKLFEKYGYPDADAHKKEHSAFVSKVQDFIAGYDKGDQKLTIEVAYFLRDWVLNHIQVSDKKYSPFLKEKM